MTGAGRGMGVDIAKAALAAGHAVVATARNAARVTGALGESEHLLAVALDVTDPHAAEAAVAQAVDRFGRIDVLVNNAGSFYAGLLRGDDARRTSARRSRPRSSARSTSPAPSCPSMRAQRSGLVVTISSTAGIAAEGEFLTAYAASKFGVEGWMEALTPEIAPYGIRTMLVEPGFFRTELLTPQSTQLRRTVYRRLRRADAANHRRVARMDGQQGGDPAKLAAALVQLAALDKPPLRFAAGADAVETLELKARTLLAQADAYRELSSGLGLIDF